MSSQWLDEVLVSGQISAAIAFNYINRLDMLIISTNHTFINETIDVMRLDRITGSVNYGKTAALLKNSKNLLDKKSKPFVICSEINRRYDTPENLLLALILVSAMIYSEKFITMTRKLVMPIRGIKPTIRKLQVIRKQLAVLLTEKSIRQILPIAIDSRGHVNGLFQSMRERIQLGRTPTYFLNIYYLFDKWRYYTRIRIKKY